MVKRRHFHGHWSKVTSDDVFWHPTSKIKLDGGHGYEAVPEGIGTHVLNREVSFDRGPRLHRTFLRTLLHQVSKFIDGCRIP